MNISVAVIVFSGKNGNENKKIFICFNMCFKHYFGNNAGYGPNIVRLRVGANRRA